MFDQELLEMVKKIKAEAVEKNYKIAVAESCTGGLVSSYLTSISGASSYFITGIVSYSNEIKTKLLNVPAEVLSRSGAVSEEVAKYMVKGVQKLSNADVALSVTGLAGPDSDESNNPIGMVCFGLYKNKEIFTSILYFSRNRDEIRHLACSHALTLILQNL